jgi:hypothetical protein
VNPFLSTWLDAWLTGIWLTLAVASEANPLLDLLIGHIGVWPTMAVRGLTGTALLAVLYALADHDAARHGLTLVRWLLTAVVVWHVAGSILLL